MDQYEFRNMRSHVLYINNLIKKTNTIIVFDTETTGLNPDANIIQFSAILYEKDGYRLKEKDTLNLYINPGKPLDPIITNITGITDKMLEDAASEKECINKILEFMKKGDIWAGYNVNFDLTKLEHMAKRCNVNYIQPEFIDVMQLARNVISKPKTGIKNYKLGTVTNFLFPDNDIKFHDSLEDVRATGKCLEFFINKYKDVKINDEKKENVVVDWASYWQNPYNKGQMRIKVFVNRKDIGIFWDCKNYCWTHKKDPASKKAFESIDIANIENQVLKKYGWRYHVDNMEDLSRQWGRSIREKEKKQNEVKEENTDTIIGFDAEIDNDIELL